MRRLRPLKSLIHDAVDATTHLVAEGHASASRLVEKTAGAVPELAEPVALAGALHRGGTDAVLGTVRGVNRIVEGITDAALDLVPQTDGPEPALPLDEGTLRSGAGAADQLLGVLNGAVGDHLAQTGNGLSLALRLRHGPDWLTDEAPAPAEATGHVAVLVHGLSTTEASWCFGATAQLGAPDAHFGRLLQADLGVTPLFARYNTGRTVAVSGDALAAALERTLAAWPVPVQSVTLIGHSMGGLVCRAASQGLALPEGARLSVACLGSPHRGAPLARLGEAATRTLLAVDLPGTRVVGKILEGRSAGIQDLGEAAALRAGPLRDDLDYLFVAGSLGGDPIPVVDDILGDMLVPVDSARGPRGADAHDRVTTRRFGGVAHHQLQTHREVYGALRDWMEARRADG